MAGVFASSSINPGIEDGLLWGGADVFGKQVIGVLVVGIFAFAMTFVLGKLVDKTIGLRVSRDEETVGLDISQHGERAYGGITI